MNDLIKNYLKMAGHYLKDKEILRIEPNIKYSGDFTDDISIYYKVSIRNECCFEGCEVIEILLDDLLIFLFKLTA